MSARPTPLLEVQDLSCGYGAQSVSRGISFKLERGEIVCLLGPNGVGKTTLFKTILRLLPLQNGRVNILGEDVSAWPRKRLAYLVGYVPQAHTPPFPFKALDVVLMGRTCHLEPFRSPGPTDLNIARQALTKLGAAPLADKIYSELSGGERQLVLIARALAQEPKILIMDEPTANLDFGNQLRLLEHVRLLAREQGLGVLLTTHEPNHALNYACQVAAMSRGGGFRLGEARDVVSERYLLETYGVRTSLIPLKTREGREGAACLPLAWGEAR